MKMFIRVMQATLAAAYLMNAACTATEFSGPPAKAEKSSTTVPGLDDPKSNSDPVDRIPAQDVDSDVRTCNYPEYTGRLNSPEQSECHSTARPALRSPNRADGRTYIISMYNASNLSHGLVPGPYRSFVTQKINVGTNLAANSVDLVLYSYEPVHWEIEGNANAVRSVHVRGYHCATVDGVDGSNVSFNTYDQGQSANLDLLPLSQNIASETSIYEGSCVAGNRFHIQ